MSRVLIGMAEAHAATALKKRAIAAVSRSPGPHSLDIQAFQKRRTQAPIAARRAEMEQNEDEDEDDS